MLKCKKHALSIKLHHNSFEADNRSPMPFPGMAEYSVAATASFAAGWGGDASEAVCMSGGHRVHYQIEKNSFEYPPIIFKVKLMFIRRR